MDRPYPDETRQEARAQGGVYLLVVLLVLGLLAVVSMRGVVAVDGHARPSNTGPTMNIEGR